MATCWHCRTESPDEHYDRIVYAKTPLHGPWAGWRLAGRWLVSPDGDRVACERLRGLLWFERVSARLKAGQQVGGSGRVLLPARERFAGSA